MDQWALQETPHHLQQLQCGIVPYSTCMYLYMHASIGHTLKLYMYMCKLWKGYCVCACVAHLALLHVHTCTCTCVHVYVHVFVCVWNCMCPCTCTCVCMHVYVSISTHFVFHTSNVRVTPFNKGGSPCILPCIIALLREDKMDAH